MVVLFLPQFLKIERKKMYVFKVLTCLTNPYRLKQFIALLVVCELVFSCIFYYTEHHHFSNCYQQFVKINSS